MKTKKMTMIQIVAVCALLTGSLFAVAAQTKSGPQKRKQPEQARSKACCFKTGSGGLTNCNKPMENGLCPATMVKAKCEGRDVNGAPTNCKE